jgi:hypothetical protein
MATPASIDRVSLKMPPFWQDDPILWFAQIESQFVLSGVSSDNTKFHAVACALENPIAKLVRDIIIKPPNEGKYNFLKDALITRLSPSKESRLKRLLQGDEIGDRTPSQFLRHLRELGGTSITDDLLRTLWLGRLPSRIQDILVANTNQDLEALAVIADRIIENTNASSYVAVLDPQPVNNVDTQLEELSRQLAALSASSSRQRARRQRSSERTTAEDEVCWYHRKFGKEATRCRKPCSFQSKNSVGRQ